MSVDNIPNKVIDSLFGNIFQLNDESEEWLESRNCYASTCDSVIFDLAFDDLRARFQSPRLFANIELLAIVLAIISLNGSLLALPQKLRKYCGATNQMDS
ncbi:hypothetical protein DICVIV_12405 [Dictyocaulus viviparus]|uniref:Uncharacterized protein n=1 Tax=Dictyocaulus viviparus TaxID=29172 RepID=A0A0D8XD93_DICVI|nr:hypothetical protein DICVIV_12405 [Dictyocaulus viviparus]